MKCVAGYPPAFSILTDSQTCYRNHFGDSSQQTMVWKVSLAMIYLQARTEVLTTFHLMWYTYMSKKLKKKQIKSKKSKEK